MYVAANTQAAEPTIEHVMPGTKKSEKSAQ
jgi:hypothetical protein